MANYWSTVIIGLPVSIAGCTNVADALIVCFLHKKTQQLLCDHLKPFFSLDSLHRKEQTHPRTRIEISHCPFIHFIARERKAAFFELKSATCKWHLMVQLLYRKRDNNQQAQSKKSTENSTTVRTWPSKLTSDI